MYLLDTNVVSELRRPRPHRGVSTWIEQTSEDQLFISAVLASEIQAGIEITRERDPAKAEEITTWLEQTVVGSNVLPMGVAAFREWARLMHRTSDTLSEDAMIAATAKVHGLTVATRNLRDFRGFGVQLFNPFGGE